MSDKLYRRKGNFQPSWVKSESGEDELLLTFYDEYDQGDDPEDQFFLKRDAAYQLFLVLKEKFRDIKKTSKEI